MAIGAILLARGWPADAARFPLVISSFLHFMAVVDLLFSQFRQDDRDEEAAAVDFKLFETEDQRLSNRRTVAIFMWLVGFFAAIILLGFPIATPLFLFFYLKLEGKEGWGLSLGLTVAIGLCFLVVYVWLMENRILEGWVYEWLKKLAST